MTRYLAFLACAGQRLDPSVTRADRPAGFHCALESDQLLLLCDDEEGVLRAPDARGAIVGTLFRRGPPSTRLRSFPSTGGAFNADYIQTDLLGGHWGGFIAFLSQSPSGGYRVLRDPSGFMPCYYSRGADHVILSSDIDLLIAVDRRPARLNWDYLGFCLCYPDHPSDQTGLIGVCELLRGFALTASANGVSLSPCWSPWDHVAYHRDDSDKEFVGRVRETVRDCVQSWASCFARVAVTLSGGLDSSLVAAAAQNAARLSCLTFYTDDPVGDERPHARMMADAIGATLHEYRHASKGIDIECTTSGHLPRPIERLVARTANEVLRAFAVEHRVASFLTGYGGDNVFCSLRSGGPIADRFLAEGLGRGVIDTLGDVCRLTRCSLWQALRHAYRSYRLTRGGYRWRSDTRFIDATDVGRAAPRHPWLNAPNGIPPGKVAHVAQLAGTHNHLERLPHDGGPELLSPLLSQPVIELCLGIPSWEWVANGQNRSIVRTAFEGFVPSPILKHMAKGGPDALYARVFEDSRERLGPFLLDGLLAAQGIVDRQQIADAIDARTPLLGTDHLRLLFLADVEAWARHWAPPSQSTA